MHAEVTFIHPRKRYVREWKMSLVIANIPAMLPSYKLGSKSNALSWLALPSGTH